MQSQRDPLISASVAAAAAAFGGNEEVVFCG